MRLLELFIVLALALLVNGASIADRSTEEPKVRYDNYRVFKIKYSNPRQREILLELTKKEQNFSLWYEDRNELHLMVSPSALTTFKGQLSKANVTAQIFIENVQDLIDNESRENSKSSPTFGWTRYNTLAEIEAWLDEILANYPEVTEGFIVGRSYEGRNIRGIKISYRAGNPGVFIESNTHAREWITSATATWFINELLTSQDNVVRELAESHDWYIVPVLNVDGFVYSHTKNRLWRKTRQPSSISTCIGVDPNRNFDSYWMANGGASTNPCSETYGGPQAFSEPEVKALADFVSSIKDKINIMLAFHSYSQYVLSPWGHTEEHPENHEDLIQVAKAFADAVQAMPYGTVYEYGTTAELLYVASGATNDWSYNEQDIKISYTVEFRDTGRFGFVLPPAFIIPNAQEALVGIVALLAESKKLGYLEPKYDL